MSKITNFFRHFRDDEGGSMVIESLFVLPALLFAYFGTYVYFDGFRSSSQLSKAAYTIADQLGRETGYITPNYLDSLYSLNELLTASPYETSLRVSVIDYDYENNDYRVRWSRRRGDYTKLTATSLETIKAQLPLIPRNEVVIVVENMMYYEAPYGNWLPSQTFSEMAAVRPRFNSSQVCWNSQENGDTSTQTC